MKHKITQKLIFFMVGTLLLLSIIIGLTFSFLFTNSTLDYYKTDLSRRAEVISRNFSAYLETSNPNSSRHNMGMGMGKNSHMMGYRPFLALIDDMAMSNVWIIAPTGEVIVESKEESLGELPSSSTEVLTKAFRGELAFSDEDSQTLQVKTLTVAAPIFNQNGDILGAVLLYSPLEGMKATTDSGRSMLIVSTVVGLILSIILAIIFSLNFIRPLKKMKNTAGILAKGDYSAKTGITQEDEIGDLARSLDFLSEKLEEASKESLRLEKSRQDFIANVSHELRTPVTVLRGSLEALKDKVVTSPMAVEKYHTQMLKEIISLQRLVDDLLSLTKLQNPDFKMDMTPLNLSELFSDVVRSGRQIAQKKSISVEFSNPYDSLPFLGDYGRLRQMLLVVLDNAVKFSKNHDRISVSLSQENTHLLLHITDYGKGIKAEELSYIFDRFHQASKENAGSGSGLGLAIAKEIAHRHNIEISVKSQENIETTFTFFFKITKFVDYDFS